MSANTLAMPSPAAATPSPAEVDNRSAYVSFGLAYALGHGATALSRGADPVLTMPGWLPMALLGAGFAAATVQSTTAAIRAQRGASKPEALSGKLLGTAWLFGFAALFLAITGLTAVFEMPELQAVLWPVGSGLVVGLIYIAEGAMRRNRLHYCLGIWLALVSTGSLFFGDPGLFWVLAVAGGGAYAVAAVLERRRLA
jgi:hypothetical protein